jgi:ribosomal protein S18 acetylase RimI-like enzyme
VTSSLLEVECGGGKERVLEPETIDIRRFKALEFTSLLEAESRTWHDELRWDFAASAQLIATCLEEKRLAGYALVKDRRIEGYCFFFYDGEKGLIGDLFVDSSRAGRDRARGLLDHAIETLIATPGTRRVEAQLPHFTFEELDPCFRSHAFEGYRRRFMAVSLVDRPPSAQHFSVVTQAANGKLRDFRIEPWERKYDREAAQLLSAVYSRHVDTLINDQYGSLAGASRLIENIVERRGCGDFLPQSSRVAIHRLSGELAGVLALTAVRPGTAHIPQLAVRDNFQSAGLGTALLESSFQELASSGTREVSLTVTDLNSGAVRLYERLGFQTFRTFGAYVWNRPSLSTSL